MPGAGAAAAAAFSRIHLEGRAPSLVLRPARRSARERRTGFMLLRSTAWQLASKAYFFYYCFLFFFET